jgi:hypothetical protein
LKGHGLIYIEDVFPSFEHNITHSLVRDSSCALLLGNFGVLSEALLFLRRISLGIYGVSLKEGLQLGFDYAFFMTCK